jgi:hypothetical protein
VAVYLDKKYNSTIKTAPRAKRPSHQVKTLKACKTNRIDAPRPSRNPCLRETLNTDCMVLLRTFLSPAWINLFLNENKMREKNENQNRKKNEKKITILGKFLIFEFCS